MKSILWHLFIMFCLINTLNSFEVKPSTIEENETLIIIIFFIVFLGFFYYFYKKYEEAKADPSKEERVPFLFSIQNRPKVEPESHIEVVYDGNEVSMEPKKKETLADYEKEAIEKALIKHKGNLTEAAKTLDVGRAFLYRKIKQHDIDPSKHRPKKS